MADFINGKQILKDGVTHVKNEAKSTLHDFVQRLASPQEANKSFIHIRDFYNFIRSTSANVPAPYFYFCPNFYAYDNSVDMKTSVTVDRGKAKLETDPDDPTANTAGRFFSKRLADFVRFRYCIQAISFPHLSIQGYNDGIGGGQTAPRDITNIYGGYTFLSNSYINAREHILDIKLLNTQRPIIENFIYPWMMEVLNTNIVDKPIPRVNMAVKYWSPDRITWNMEGVKPDFVYYITGMFPIDIDTWNPKQAMGGDGDIQRTVKFAYNDFVILNSYSDALKYNLVEFFIGNAINNAVAKGKQWLDKKIDSWIDGLGKKKKKKKKKKDNGSSGGGGGCCPPSAKPENPSSPQSNNNDNGDDDNSSEPDNSNDNSSNSGNDNSKSNMTLDEAVKIADRRNSDTRFSSIIENRDEASRAKENGVTRTATISSLGGSSKPSMSGISRVNTVGSIGGEPEIENMNLDESVTMENDDRADSSNMTLDENIQMFNILNADEDFPEIVDADDEADHAQDSKNLTALKQTMTQVDPNAGDKINLLKETTAVKPTQVTTEKKPTEYDVSPTTNKVVSTTKSTPQLHRNLLNNYTSTPSQNRQVNNATLGVSTDRDRLASPTPVKQQPVVQSSSSKLPEDYKNVEKAPTVKRTDPVALANAYDGPTNAERHQDVSKTVQANPTDNGLTNVERHQDVSKTNQVNPTDVDFKVTSKKPVTSTDVNYKIEKSALSHYISQEALRQIRPNNGDNSVHGLFENAIGNAEQNDVSREQLTLEDSIRLMNAKRTDEDFGEIINVEDELDTSKSKSADKSFRELAKGTILFTENGVQPVQRDYSSIRTMLMTSDSLNGMKYGIIKEYADFANAEMKDILQEYKTNRAASVDKIIGGLMQKDSYTIETQHNDERTKSEVEALKRNDGTYNKVTIENYKMKPPENFDNEARKQEAIRAIKKSGKVDTVQVNHQRPQLTASDIEDIF